MYRWCGNSRPLRNPRLFTRACKNGVSFFTRMWETPKTARDNGFRDLQTRSLVTVHFALTIDGKVSTVGHTPAQFTSARDKRRLLEVRSKNDAVLVARGTLEKDRMSLGLPDQALRQERSRCGASEEPLRVIVSGSGEISSNLPIFKNPGSPIVLYTTSKIADSKRTELEPQGPIHDAAQERIDLNYAVSHLFSHYHVRTVAWEGGPSLVRSLV